MNEFKIEDVKELTPKEQKHIKENYFHSDKPQEKYQGQLIVIVKN